MKGDVRIEDQVAIAPGVILQADPGSQIIIRAGACIGMGAIIHAHQGTLEVESGAVLGAGVLFLGCGKIGSNACIGTSSTVWNRSVEASQLVAPGSLLTAQAEAPSSSEPDISALESTEAIAPGTENQEPPPDPPESLTTPTPELPIPQPSSPAPPPSETLPDPFEEIPEESPEVSAPPLAAPSVVSPPSPTFFAGAVYGQANLNRLLVTLFPHHPAANTLTPDGANLEPEKPPEESP